MSASYVLHSKCLAGGRKSTVLRVSTFFIVYMERGGYVDLNVGALKGQRHQISRCWRWDVSRRMWAVLEMWATGCGHWKVNSAQKALSGWAISPAPSTSLVKGEKLTTREKRGEWGGTAAIRSTRCPQRVKFTHMDEFQRHPKKTRETKERGFEKGQRRASVKLGCGPYPDIYTGDGEVLKHHRQTAIRLKTLGACLWLSFVWTEVISFTWVEIMSTHCVALIIPGWWETMIGG